MPQNNKNNKKNLKNKQNKLKQRAGTRSIKKGSNLKNKTYKKNQRGGTWGGFIVGTGFGGLLYKWFSMRTDKK